MNPMNGHRQRGIVLFASLIFLIVVTMIGLASMRSSTLELRMSLNEESRVSAFQQAQAMSDAIIFTPSSTPVVGDVGHRICTTSVPGAVACDQRDLMIPNAFIQGEIGAGTLSAIVERVGSDTRPPPRGLDSSLDKFAAPTFRIQSTYDREAEGLGSSTLNEGVLVLIPRL
jgi:hypothetical protein